MDHQPASMEQEEGAEEGPLSPDQRCANDVTRESRRSKDHWERSEDLLPTVDSPPWDPSSLRTRFHRQCPHLLPASRRLG